MHSDWEEAKELDLVAGGQGRTEQDVLGSATAAAGIMLGLIGFLLICLALRGAGIW